MSAERVPINDTNFAKTIQRMIWDEGMNITEAAEKAGLHSSTISNWINAGNDPTLGRMCWVLAALGYRLEAVKEDVKEDGEEEEA